MSPPGTARLQPGLRSSPSLGPCWHSRGYLPHLESSGIAQHVTFHLADSLPTRALRQLTSHLGPDSTRAIELRRRIESWIDAGHGSCLLRQPDAARLMEDSLLRFDGDRYRLLAWIVMPNHVHVLLEVSGSWTLARIVASWKSFTGRRLAHLVDKQGSARRQVWHREYWDRFIRNDEHFLVARKYIHENPVRAGLVKRPEDWEWGSARREGEVRAM